MHELLGRLRVLGDDHTLLHEVQLHAELVEDDVVAEVPVHTIGLLGDDHPPTHRLLLEPAEQLVEVLSAGLAPALHVHKGGGDLEAVPLGVVAQRGVLGLQRVALLLLLAGAHPLIEGDETGQRGRWSGGGGSACHGAYTE
ncbi:MAG: hypothetical protein IPN01_14985 [Deltaproteobacteria bacterium]|nr:hypothetical protein [Deltaproteobacteria bacterium]